jgi:hypothetical protein
VARMGHQRIYKYNQFDPDIDFLIDQQNLQFHPKYVDAKVSEIQLTTDGVGRHISAA